MVKCEHCGSKYVNVRQGNGEIIVVCKECMMITKVKDDKGA